MPVQGVVQCAGSTILQTISAPNRTMTATGGAPGGTWTSSNPAIIAIGATASNVCTVTALTAGTANITYTVTNGCGTRFSKLGLSSVVSREGTQATGTVGTTAFAAHPNPTSGELTVNAPVTGIFTVYTIDGREVSKYEINEATVKIMLPSNLASGVYMCRFNGIDGSTTVVRLVYEP